MRPLTAEERAYKERTIERLSANFRLLEQRLEKEKRVEVVESIQSQLEEIQLHLALLQQELTTNVAVEPVADKLYRRIATALTNNKFYLAKGLINKLETIEPYYPGIDRLRAEAEAGRASRRTQAISKGGALPEIILSPEMVEVAASQTLTRLTVVDGEGGGLEPEKKGLARFLQFHIVASCLVVSLIICMLFGVGGMTALQWLIEGN